MQTEGYVKNWGLNFVKLAAACFVVFIHINFPGKFGEAMDCLGRFAVPLFFAVSGYYSYRIDSRKIRKRISRLMLLLVSATAIYVLWAAWQAKFIDGPGIRTMLREKITIENAARFIFLGDIPFAAHLWYLTAIVECYCFYWGYISFYRTEPDYRWLYMFASVLYAIQLTLSLLAVAVSLQFDHILYRNAVLFGIPMFTMGLFLRQYRERLVTAFRITVPRGIIMIVVCAMLSLLQWFGFGRTEFPLATLPEVAVILLLVQTSERFAAVPNKWIGRASDFAESLSESVYIIHILLIKMVTGYTEYNAFATALYARKRLYPMAVLLGSVFLGTVWYFLKKIYPALKKQRSRKTASVS